jgi:uncharacterized membrane protein
MELCKPATAILLVAGAGSLYHALVGEYDTMTWWLVTAIFGTGAFQALCYGGLEPIAWLLMLLPVLIVCFFFAVALFSSYLRITTGKKRHERREERREKRCEEREERREERCEERCTPEPEC